jgi:hypothetical protein
MKTNSRIYKIAILGGGPSALFIYKRLIGLANANQLEIHIFEKNKHLGFGMPYGSEGANNEHITNVSGNEIPKIYESVLKWIENEAPQSVLRKFKINAQNFNDYKVMPRLFFGKYLQSQFKELIKEAKAKGIKTVVNYNTIVSDVNYLSKTNKVKVTFSDSEELFDNAIICVGHNWPKKLEGKIDGYFDSPYPPQKLQLQLNQPVAITGGSLTAIDAVRTLARKNGKFIHHRDGNYSYKIDHKSKGFKLVLHTIDGLLPGLRFHLSNARLQDKSLLTNEEIKAHMKSNNGFLSLDFIFEKDFKEILKKKDKAFYQEIKDLSLEDFVELMLSKREKRDPMELFKEEYEEAAKSIANRKSVYWKEVLAMLSFAMNYPAKHFSAEDGLRLKQTLMPLISIIIAFVPQGSARELIALHDAGILEIVSVDRDSKVVPGKKSGITYHYKINKQEMAVDYETYVNCIGQPHFSFEDFIFKGLSKANEVSRATLQFRSKIEAKKHIEKNLEDVIIDDKGNYQLIVPGLKINDHFQIVNAQEKANDQIYLMAVPYMGGYNPDYSGLDFGEEASGLIIEKLKKQLI